MENYLFPFDNIFLKHNVPFFYEQKTPILVVCFHLKKACFAPARPSSSATIAQGEYWTGSEEYHSG